MKTKLFLALVGVCCSQAMAWGGVGHRTTGVLAQAHLLPHTAAEVAKLLGDESLADVANWADRVRDNGNSYRQTVWYHFEKVADGLTYLENLEVLPDWQKKKGGTIGAILMASKILRDPQATVGERAEALKFLVHFVGDVHQPLHTGRPHDNGGSKVQVNWFGTKMSLHRVWDSAMIMTGHPDLVKFVENENELASELKSSSEAYAEFLRERHGHTPVDGTMNVEGWFNESLALRAGAYDPIYNTDQALYQSLNLPEIDSRIYLAGVRLAGLLNSIFSGQPVPQSQIFLWEDIEYIVGDLNDVISFKP